ncbi:PH domain-containing protein [Arthrobacter sp. zg-Y40]|uniref:PH domain-containing protein n=1 Tax=Arthrobacter sp. zg-Y40 TaxID=2886939 RepID=UPI001D151919|nr:PH domain-containing protein [Arthrobacter sp. zg-Y40]
MTGGEAAPVPDGPPDVPEPAGAAAEPAWNRVHPVSPLVHGWIALAAVAYFVGRDQAEGWFSGGGMRLPHGEALFWALLILGAVLVLIAGAFFLSWWFTRYQLASEHIRVHSGVLFRQQRQARLDRVQAIDIVQPLLARIFGLAELRFEVADAGESAVRLAYLRLPDAQALRERILRGASGAGEDPEEAAAGGSAPTVPGEQEVLSLSAGRVIGSAVLSSTTVLLLLAVAAVVILTKVTGELGSVAAMVPIIFGFGSAYWGMFSSSFNFRASVSRDGLRIRSGLLDTRAQTVPPGRIQAVAVRQSPLWRLAGWYSVSVNVAGYGAGSSTGDSAARTRLLPVGTAEEVFRMLALVLPDPGTKDPVEVFTAGMNGSGERAGYTVSPRRARWLSPLSRRRNGFLVTGSALLARRGYFWRSLDVVPHSRTQSLALEQGPVQRRLRLASLVLHSTPGPVSPKVVELDAGTALALLDEQAARARAARHRDLPEQWLRHNPNYPLSLSKEEHEHP